MIKKLIYLLTIINVFVMSLLSYTSIISLDDCHIGAIPDHITIQEKNKVLYFYLDFNEDITKGIDEILNYCQAKRQTIMMISSYNKSGTHYVNWYLYSQNKNDLKGLKIIKQKDIDFSKYDTKQYYSTNKKDIDSIGQLVTIDFNYYDNAPDQYTLNNMNEICKVIKNNDNKIAMQLYSNNPENLLNDMMHIFQNENIACNNVTDGYYPAQIETVNDEKMKKLNILFILSTILIVLLLIIYILKLKRTIMIKRLNGLSVFKIMLSEFGIFMFNEIIIFIVSLLIFMYLKAGDLSIYNANYYELSFNFIGIFLGLMMIFLIVIYIFICKTTHLKYLHSNYRINKIAEINVLLKVVIICLLVSPLTSLISNVKDSIISYKVFYDNRETISNLAYINGGFSSVSKEYEIFDYLMQHGGIYVDFQMYANNNTDFLKEIFAADDISDEEIAEMAIDYPFIFANANYLNNHHIKDENGKIIDLYQYQEDVILVPEKYKNENIKKIMFGRDLKIIYIKDTDKYVNYKLETPYYLSNPVIRLVTHKTDDAKIQFMNLDLTSKSIKEFQNEILQYIGVDNLSIDIVKQSSKIDYLIRNTKDDLIEAIFILSIYIVFLMIIIYQTTYLYFNEKQMNLSLQYIYGYSFKERYQELFVYSFMTYFITILIGLIILKFDFGSLLLFSFSSLVIELFIQLLLIKSFENRNIVSILKGEIY